MDNNKDDIILELTEINIKLQEYNNELKDFQCLQILTKICKLKTNKYITFNLKRM